MLNKITSLNSRLALMHAGISVRSCDPFIIQSLILNYTSFWMHYACWRQMDFDPFFTIFLHFAWIIHFIPKFRTLFNAGLFHLEPLYLSHVTCTDTWLGIPYARHHNPLLIRNRSWILAIHKDRRFWKNLLENKEMVFKKWVKNIQTPGYNGVNTIVNVLNFN